jgi:hypothetical protein
MVTLLGQGDGGFLGADTDLEAGAGGRDGQVAVSQPAHQVEGLVRRLLARQAQGVGGDVGFDHGTHLGGGAEETVCRRQALQRLVRALEVVVLDEEADTALAIVEVGKHGAGQKLFPHGLPEALDLAAGLRVVRPALDVLDALAAQLFLEVGGAAPGGVLPALVGEDLPRCAVVGDGPRQRLHHQRAALVVGHDQAHQVAGVVIQEGSHVDALMPPQQEGEQIRLPQLVGLGTLEAVLLRRRLGPGRLLHRHQPFLVQHAPHGRLRGADAEPAAHHVADAAAAGVGVCGLGRHNRCMARIVALLLLRGRPRLCHQCFRATLAVAGRPSRCRGVRHSKLLGHLVDVELLLHHRLGYRDAYIQRPGLRVHTRSSCFTTCTLRLCFTFHLSSPGSPLRQAYPEDKC